MWEDKYLGEVNETDLNLSTQWNNIASGKRVLCE